MHANRCLVVMAMASALAACGGSEAAPATSDPGAEAPQPGTEPSPGPTDGCAQDADCAPDHDCVPTECVPRGRAVTDQVCEERGPPIGDCVCRAGECVVDAAPPRSDRCTRDAECGPDDHCVPTACVLRGIRDPAAEPDCEETGPPIGACVCVEGACEEVPFDAPDGRDARRRR